MLQPLRNNRTRQQVSIGRSTPPPVGGLNLRDALSKMDAEDAAAWVDLGRILLLASLDQPLATKRSDRAFRQAVRLDPTMGEAVTAARNEVEDVRIERAEAVAAAKAERLRTLSPEGGPWRHDWRRSGASASSYLLRRPDCCLAFARANPGSGAAGHYRLRRVCPASRACYVAGL